MPAVRFRDGAAHVERVAVTVVGVDQQAKLPARQMRLAWAANSVSLGRRSGAPSTAIERPSRKTSRPRSRESSAMRAEIASYTEPGCTQRCPERSARKRSRRSVQFMMAASSKVIGWEDLSDRFRRSAYHGFRIVEDQIMEKRIAFVGAGAVGGYVGAYFARNGLDVTLIDPWPEHIEAIRARGLELDGMTAEERFSVKTAKTMHLTELQPLAKEQPIDIAFVSVKSYDTEWATMMIRQYLAPDGFVVSLQNCMNEERIAGIVGWGKTVGCIAARIAVDLHAPGRIRRTVAKGGSAHTVFRVGEVHGRTTRRVEALAAMFAGIDSVKVTSNLWGERWSKLCVNGMRNGVSAATGLPGNDSDRDERIRRFAIQLGGEAVRIGQALGYELEHIRQSRSETPCAGP